MTAVREENGSLPASSLERLSSPDAAHGVSSPVLMARDDLLTALELQTSRFNIVLENIPQGLCFFSADQRLILHNRRYAEIYGLSDDEVRPGMTLLEILTLRVAHGSVPDMAADAYIAWTQARVAALTPDGSVVYLKNGRAVSIRHQPTPDGGYVATHEDVTERYQAEARIAFMARHDALTQLPNRLLFHERLDQAKELAENGTGYAILCLDLDRFKIINDMLGHSSGDGVLQAAAERLRACVHELDTVARLGGDEFAIIRLGNGSHDAAFLANRIINSFHPSFEINGHQLLIGTSIGIALAADNGISTDQLLKNADIALSLAKVEGGSTVRFFEPEMDTRIQLRRTQEIDLRTAIARSEFKVYYQPLVNLSTGRITAFEALLRWDHPTRGLVSPSEFIPLAEETGMILAIGAWVLRTACFEAKNWPSDIHIAVNLSPKQFHKGDLVAVVREALDLSELRPERLEVEITESVLLQDSASVIGALDQLRALGISIALDDFGTGYSSLSYLRTFPFNKIKIDQGFIRDLTQDDEARSIVRAVTSLGRDLHMTTVAEGVESLEQLNKLRDEGCMEVQGYIFSRPRPATEISALIKSWHVTGGPIAMSK
jgi:diguanylate cyclase (GGDEF)-like protein/PAS domain S-box-containing protein